MKVWFLGTGTSQGIPVIGSSHPVCHSNDPKDKRLRVSVWIHWDNYSFVIDCGPDFRQQIADSWPASIDDSAARAEWGWEPEYDLPAMVADMLTRLRTRLESGTLYAAAR